MIVADHPGFRRLCLTPSLKHVLCQSGEWAHDPVLMGADVEAAVCVWRARHMASAVVRPQMRLVCLNRRPLWCGLCGFLVDGTLCVCSL